IDGWTRWLWCKLLPTTQPTVASRLQELEPFQDRLWLNSAKSCGVLKPPTAPVWIMTSPGDVVFFDPRLIHVGGHLPNRTGAVFFALGARNLLSRRHRDFFGGTALDAAGGAQRAAFTDLLARTDLSLE